MKISIIIPIYKVEKYLRRCLDSVINQTYKDIEIILVNDGSPDKCGEICDEYAKKDNRVQVIHKENEGVCEARNFGMQIMTGDYIFFLDSDDFIEKEALNILYQRAEKTGADIVIGNYKIVNEKNKITFKKAFEIARLDKDHLKNSTERFKYFFGKSYGVQIWNKLYKSSFIRISNISFEKEIYYGEDFIFNLKLFVNYPKIELVNEYTYFYFQNTESITNSYKRCLTEQYFNLMQSFYNTVKENNKLDENRDLIAYSAFTAVDNICLNSYQYSGDVYKEMKLEIKKTKQSEIIKQGIRNLAKGKYLKDVPRKDWKVYAWIFSVLYSLNFLSLATLLQVLRFRIKEI